MRSPSAVWDKRDAPLCAFGHMHIYLACGGVLAHLEYDADLRLTGWENQLDDLGPFNDVVSVATMHDVSASEVHAVYGSITSLIRSRGLFFNAEHLAAGPVRWTLTKTLAMIRRRSRPPRERWLQDITAGPALAALLRQTSRPSDPRLAR